VKHTQQQAIQARAAVVPTVRYRDVPAAIAWLCDALGFEEHRVVKDSDGSVLYAQLSFGKGMVMVAPIKETAFGKLMVQPDEIGGVETQICYLLVEDAGAHQARAAAAGADIVLDIKAEASTGRGYSCRDPEGHIWNFGTYDPWDGSASPMPLRPRSQGRLRALAVAAVLIAAGVASYAHEPSRAGAGYLSHALYAKVAAVFEAARAASPEDDASVEPLARALGEARDQLAKERVARLAADQYLSELREQLAQVRRPTYGQDELMHARLALNITAKKLEQAVADKEEAERGLKEAQEQLAQLRGAKEAFEKAAKEEREQFLRKRAARLAAVRAAVARRNAAPVPRPEYPF
jgi:uncharacterized glyoxalase superfamily protein PhnB